MSPTAGADDQTIKAWAASPSTYLATAALLACDLRGKPSGMPVSSSKTLARRYRVSASSVNRAKRILARHGIISKTTTGYSYITGPDAGKRKGG